MINLLTIYRITVSIKDASLSKAIDNIFYLLIYKFAFFRDLADWQSVKINHPLEAQLENLTYFE